MTVDPEAAEPLWRRNVSEVAATMAACRDELRATGITASTAELIEMARLSMAREWGWPRRTGTPNPLSD
jgi:hypothetical protein